MGVRRQKREARNSLQYLIDLWNEWRFISTSTIRLHGVKVRHKGYTTINLLLEKMIVAQLVKSSPAFTELSCTQRPVTGFVQTSAGPRYRAVAGSCENGSKPSFLIRRATISFSKKIYIYFRTSVILTLWNRRQSVRKDSRRVEVKRKIWGRGHSARRSPGNARSSF
jgi:hypothetical protein